LFLWGIGGDSNKYLIVQAVTVGLCLEWVVFVLTWRRPCFPLVLAIFLLAAVLCGWSLIRMNRTYFWGLGNVLYILNFIPFAFGVRRWQLEVTNTFIWLLLVYGFL
jgi:hypothetical protein